MAYADEVLADSPLAWYRLGEASGNVLDSVAAGADGTITGTVVRDVVGALETGDDGAIDFDGTTGYITVPDHDKFSLATTGKLSLEAWWKPDTIAGADRPVLWKGATSNFEYFMRDYNGQTYFTLYQISGTARCTVSSAPGIPALIKRHVVVTLDDAIDTAILYVNGVVVATETVWAGLSANGTAAFNIGARTDATLVYFDGVIDEVAVYGAVLPPARVRSHYRSGLLLKAPAPEFPKAKLRRAA